MKYRDYQKINVSEIRANLTNVDSDVFTIYEDGGMMHINIKFQDEDEEPINKLTMVYISADEEYVTYGTCSMSDDSYRVWRSSKQDFIVPFQGCNLWQKSVYDFLAKKRTRPIMTEYQTVVEGWDEDEIYNLIKVIKAGF